MRNNIEQEDSLPYSNCELLEITIQEEHSGIRTLNTQEPRWKVVFRIKQVYQKKELKKAVRLTGRTHTERVQTFPRSSIESDGFGIIMVS